MAKELLFKVTAKDCDWDFYIGGGNGGQNKQKTASACRCTHRASGAVGTAQDTRSQELNKRKAFERMANTEVFQKWMKAEISRQTGRLQEINEKVNFELLNNTVVEASKDGKWVEAPELAVNHWDIRNLNEL